MFQEEQKHMKQLFEVTMTTLESGIPESFNVLIMELKSLGLNVELLERNVN